MHKLLTIILSTTKAFDEDGSNKERNWKTRLITDVDDYDW